MYLNLLTEKEQSNFMKMAYLVANIDGDFAKEEKILMSQYEEEMDLSIFLEEYEIKSLDVDQVIRYFDLSEKKNLRIIFTELLGLVLSDKKLEKSEKKFVNKFINYYDISDDFYNEAKTLVGNINNSYKKLNEMIFSE